MTTIPFNLNYAKKVFFLASPVMLQQLVSALANLVDNFMVGAIGPVTSELDINNLSTLVTGADAINGVGASGQIFFVIMLLGFGISEGTSIFIAQQFGSKKFAQMHLTFLVGILLSIFVGVVSAIFIWFFKSYLVSFYTAVSIQQTLAFNYLNIAVFSYPIILVNIMIGSAYRSCGNTLIPMLAGVCTILVNTLLNYFLINGNLGAPALGVVGASIATLIARILELLILVFLVESRRMPFRPNVRDLFRIPFHLVKSILKKSIPLMGNEFLWGLGVSLLMGYYAYRHADDYTAVQIASTVANLLWVIMSGFAVSVAILIGQELGNASLDSAKRHSVYLLKLAGYTGVLVMLFALLLSIIIPYCYKTVSMDIKQDASSILRILALFFPVFILNATNFFILRAGGDVRGVLIMDSVYMWGIVVPLAYTLTHHTTISIIMVYFLVQSADLGKLLISFYRYKQGYWVKTLV